MPLRRLWEPERRKRGRGRVGGSRRGEWAEEIRKQKCCKEKKRSWKGEEWAECDREVGCLRHYQKIPNAIISQ